MRSRKASIRLHRTFQRVHLQAASFSVGFVDNQIVINHLDHRNIEKPSLYSVPLTTHRHVGTFTTAALTLRHPHCLRRCP